VLSVLVYVSFPFPFSFPFLVTVTRVPQSAFERMVEESVRILARAYSKNSPSVARAVVADW
jgi:hypothetical protein